MIFGFAGLRDMVDVDSALLSVQERDNWRRRMEVLERSLGEVRARRHKLDIRLRRIRKELARLRVTSDAVRDHARPARRPEVIHVPSPVALHNR